MSWKVVKNNEQGQRERILSKELTIDNFNAIDWDNYRLLKYLDPYGDTTFNRLQLNDLLSDLKQLENTGRLDSEVYLELENLIQQCAHDVHTYIVFYGD